MIRTEGLTKRYQMAESLVTAVDGVSVTIDDGEFCAIVGRSGSGKSTLLNMIGGLDRPTSGNVVVNGSDLAQKSSADLALYRNRDVGFIFQSFQLMPHMSALENVEMPLMLAGVERGMRRSASEKALEVVGLSTRARHKPSELSGGEQQRAAIARAIANNPSLILADEPTGNLDAKTSEEIFALLRRLNQEGGKTVLIVTHDMESARAYSRRIYTLSDGRIS